MKGSVVSTAERGAQGTESASLAEDDGSHPTRTQGKQLKKSLVDKRTSPGSQGRGGLQQRASVAPGPGRTGSGWGGTYSEQ